jgi:hypothetical protein
MFQLIGMGYYCIPIWAYAKEQNTSINFFNSQKIYILCVFFYTVLRIKEKTFNLQYCGHF